MYRMVFTKIFRWLMLGLLGIGISSCEAYRTLQIQVLQPAIKQIEPGQKLALLERNIHDESRIITFIRNYPALDRQYLFEDFCEGVKNTFVNSGYSDSIVCLKEQAITILKNHSHPLPYSQDSIYNICQKFGVDYVLSIESQHFSSSNRIGDMEGNWFLRLYDKNLAGPIDSADITYIISDDLYNEFENIQECLRNCFWEVGNIAAQRLIPYWQDTERRVYHCGKVLRLGDSFFKRGNIDQALNIWTGALQLSPKTAVCAGINLGWLYENAGDFEQAAAVLAKCQRLASEKGLKGSEVDYLNGYLETIQQRIQKIKILDQQIIPVED